MGGRSHDDIDAMYRRSLGVRSGYLPDDRAVLDRWHERIAALVQRDDLPSDVLSEDLPRWTSPGVNELAALMRDDPIVRMYVTEMISQALDLTEDATRKRMAIETVPQLLLALDTIVVLAPIYQDLPFPMSALLAYMMMTPAGEAVFRDDRFNAVLRSILSEWCRFLDSKGSLLVVTPEEGGWLSPRAVEELHLDDFVTQEMKTADPYHWGFTSWNDFFHREILEGRRPLCDADNPMVIVSANDGHVYNFATNVRPYDTFWAKGQPYSLHDMLDGHYLERFGGGDVIQSFLSGSDYHRFVAPVGGTVVQCEVVEGLMFSNAESAGPDSHAGVLSQGYEVSVNTRGLIFIEGDGDVGMVCVIPIGITEVSSISFAKGVEPGKRVDKGQELGMFSFGGSTLVMVFEPGKIDYYTLKAPEVGDTNAGPAGSINSPVMAKARIAMALGK